MAIRRWGVSRKHFAVVRLRVIVARDRGAAAGRQPAFPLAFGRHSSAPAGRRRESFRTFTTLIAEPRSVPL